MADVTAQLTAGKVVLGLADYSVANPGVIVLQKDAVRDITIHVTTTLLSGAGCTVTVTATDADTGVVLGSLAVSAVGTFDKTIVCPDSTHRVALTCVKSGTTTTLTYRITADWVGMAYRSLPFWNGTSYANPASHLH